MKYFYCNANFYFSSLFWKGIKQLVFWKTSENVASNFMCPFFLFWLIILLPQPNFMIFFENLLPVLMNTHKCFSFHFLFLGHFRNLKNPHYSQLCFGFYFFPCIFSISCYFAHFSRKKHLPSSDSLTPQGNRPPWKLYQRGKKRGKASFTQGHHLNLGSLITLGLAATKYYFYLSSSLRFTQACIIHNRGYKSERVNLF